MTTLKAVKSIGVISSQDNTAIVVGSLCEGSNGLCAIPRATSLERSCGLGGIEKRINPLGTRQNGLEEERARDYLHM